jgi:hypothetical protein
MIRRRLVPVILCGVLIQHTGSPTPADLNHGGSFLQGLVTRKLTGRSEGYAVMYVAG